jgi:DNA-binding CsgD family transcriptional regulator
LQRTRLLAAGKSNQRIARLGAANRTEAAARAASSA